MSKPIKKKQLNFKKYWQPLNTFTYSPILLLLLLMITSTSCSKNEPLESVAETLTTEKITVKDIDLNASNDDNSILVYLRMQEEFALTHKQFNTQFKDYVMRSGLNKKINAGEVPKEMIDNLKYDFFLRMISNEILYQEGLSIPEIVVTPDEIDKLVSREMLRNNKQQDLTFEKYLESRGLTHQEYTQKVKKELYIKKVLNEQMKFMTSPTPSEIENLYLNIAKTGQFSEKFREVFLIEFPSSAEPVSQIQIDEIKDLDTFRQIAKEESIHSSAKKEGSIEYVPYKRTSEQRNNPNLISNLFFEDLWQMAIAKPTFLKVEDRNFLIWVNKEFEKQDQLTMEIQQHLIRFLSTQKKALLEQNYTLKISNKFSFKIRYKDNLVPLNLKKFYENSLKNFNEAPKEKQEK